MKKEYVHKSIPQLHAEYRRQAQKVCMTFEDGSPYYLFNWYGSIFFMDSKLRYIPNNDLIKLAKPFKLNDWYSRVNTSHLHYFPEDTPSNLTPAERVAAKTIAAQLKKDPLFELTDVQKAHILDILKKRIEHKKWMELKSEELKERYKNYIKDDSPVPLIVLIELSGMYLGELSSVYERIDTFHKENIEGKELTDALKMKEKEFLETLEKELDYAAEADHMAMI